jgi:hypothetical protein
MPCKDFDANSLYINICALAYNIFQIFRLVLPQQFNNSRLKKVSSTVYHNAAKIVSHARQLTVKVQSSAIHIITATIENIKRLNFEQHFFNELSLY